MNNRYRDMKKIFLIDANLCVGCRICENICSLTKERNSNPRLARIRIVKLEKEGVDMPSFCRQCVNPPCVKACPSDAITKNPTGIVVVDEAKCIGCGKCLIACPFGAITLHTERGTAIKCDLCEGSPKCVEWCPTHAIQYKEPLNVTTSKQTDYVKKLARTKTNMEV